MAILTASEVTLYSNISATAGTITSENLIPVVQERITMLLNNYFTTDLYLQDVATFNATARTITVSGSSFIEQGFSSGDDIFVYGSYRNDGYYTVLSASSTILELATGASVVDELSGASILFSVVRWPLPVKVAAAKMCAYDYDTRDSVAANIKSHSLGPWSETFTDGGQDEFGYPKKITGAIEQYRIARAF